jgi:glutamate dehydrogenase
MMVGERELMRPLSADQRSLIKAVLARAERQADKQVNLAQLRAFIIQYYQKVEVEDLRASSAAHLAITACRHFQLGQRRRPQQTLISCDGLDASTNAQANTQASSHTSINLIVDDLPFLVDSVCMVLARFGLGVQLIVHPVLQVARTSQGRWRALLNDQTSAAHNGVQRESWQRYEIDRITDPTRMADLLKAIESALNDVAVACADWQAMRERALDICESWDKTPPPISTIELQESNAFLRWLTDNHFTFLGSQQFTLKRGAKHDTLEAVAGTALGLMKTSAAKPLDAVQLSGEVRTHARMPQLLLITKSGAMATVHRAVHLDQISIKQLDKHGAVRGETRFLGLFTSNVYSLRARDVPMLRHKLTQVIAAMGYAAGSHDAKAVQHVLDTYPRDELFQATAAELEVTVRGIVNLYERRRVRLFLRLEVFKRFYSCLLFLPRDRYNTQVRERIEGHLLAALGGNNVESQVLLSDSALVRLHLLIHIKRESRAEVNAAALEADITHLIRTWQDELSAALVTRHGQITASRLSNHYANAFPAAYQADVSPTAALADIDQLQQVGESTDRMELRLNEHAGHLHLRVIRRGAPLPLSDVLPLIENLGLRVLTERPYEIEPQHARSLWIQDFELEPGRTINIQSSTLSVLFHDAFLAIWQGQIENDGFNRLITQCLLGWREVNVLRAYCRYLLQTGLPFSQRYMEQALASHADIATLLWQLFAARFDPAIKSSDRAQRCGALTKQIEAALDGVSSPDEDRILRSYLIVINASLRTNFYQLDASGNCRPQLSFKLSSGDIPHLPLPKPLFEIFVHSPRVEGVHLRMGAVARGGLRWSDRREDFRTEVLGLMKAQNVKNSVIVPVGAKGGFVPKRLPMTATREETQREGIECYRSFVRGLLDITDNIVNGKTIAPDNVVRHDADDPYLVVAADKGTASFSNIANGVAAEYNFWLGDAFASGGSAGYDHKKMAITARGAWECVKRHCREMGINVDTQDFTVCGIGDMAGDVFGNGLLRSPHMKLLAAFNHQHIFIDPDPDAARSFKERQRLFDLPRSSWQDYDAKLISKGGGIFSRGAKSIALSPQAREVLGITDASLPPSALVHAILRMPVDLLWNGGIGTYVKASAEPHLEVGDRSNDAVRVNGCELRCKVVGEGGNLGLTQRGRIEYALNGGRLNTDFIDNSAGVDCSDHEVNIKILLSLSSAKELPGNQRNALLAGMTEDMSQLVLRDNYLQSQALSMSEQVASTRLQEHAHLIRSLEQSYGLNRVLEGLPSADEINQRQLAGRGLTRPELSVLLSYSKMALYKHLISTDIADDPYLAQELQRYFPPTLSQRFAGKLHQHRLAREIITTAITNSMINRMGPGFATRSEEDTGADAARIARAYTIARETFEMRTLWADIEALDNQVPPALQYQMMNASTRLLRFVTYWLLNRHPQALHIQQQVARLQPGIRQLTAALPRLLPDAGLDAVTVKQLATLQAQGVPARLAEKIGYLQALCAGPDIVELSAGQQRAVTEIAQLYFGLNNSLPLAWLGNQILGLNASDHWQALARNTLRDQLYALQRNLCTQILRSKPKLTIANALSDWQNRQQQAIQTSRQVLQEIQSASKVDFASLSVALQAVRKLVE